MISDIWMYLFLDFLMTYERELLSKQNLYIHYNIYIYKQLYIYIHMHNLYIYIHNGMCVYMFIMVQNRASAGNHGIQGLLHQVSSDVQA